MSREAENNHCPELCGIRQMKQKRKMNFKVEKLNSCFFISKQEKEYLASEPEKAVFFFSKSLS